MAAAAFTPTPTPTFTPTFAGASSPDLVGPVARCGKPCSGLSSGGAGGVLCVPPLRLPPMRLPPACAYLPSFALRFSALSAAQRRPMLTPLSSVEGRKCPFLLYLLLLS